MKQRRFGSFSSWFGKGSPESSSSPSADPTGSAPRDQNDGEWFLEGALDFNQALVVPLDVNPFVVGRDPQCDLAVSSTEVSRRHAEILFSDGRFWITDLGSTNGTYVNRVRIAEHTPIRPGDVLHFGKVEFRFNHRPMNAAEEASSVFSGDATQMVTIQDPDEDLTGRFVTCETEFRQMLKGGQIAAYFQPIVTIDDGRTVAFEVLGRGQRDDLPQAPYRLLRIAEKMGKVVELSEMFRLKGVEQGRSLPGSPLLFVNTHPAERLGHGLEQSLERLRGLLPDGRLVLEVHESAVTDLAMMRELKALLKDLGFLLAYDDFGAGQARLNELVEVPPDFLKFDASLVRFVHKSSPRKQDMIQKLVKIAADLGVHTLAECVELEEEVALCRSMGFTHAQGYYFGRPSSFADLNR